MRKRLGSLLLAISLSFGMVAMPFYDNVSTVAYADELNVFREAQLMADGSIHIRCKYPLPSETDFTAKTKLVDGEGNEIKVKECKINGRAGDAYVDGELEFGGDYTLSIEGFEEPVKINISGLFSTPKFEDSYTYDGDDLGATYTAEKTTFKLWAPTASAVKVNIYTSGDKANSDLEESIDMTLGEKGVWTAEKTGDIKGKYYTYTATLDGAEKEADDPYSKAVGVNGDRSMVVDLAETNPDGWDTDTRKTVKNVTDAVIYELHVRDFSVDGDSGISEANKGKYLAFTEKGTKTSKGIVSGIDHIKDLGVNMVHILPSYDFGSVDEKNGGYNWGYDPKNYQVPEGSYSTDPTDGAVRIKEYKQMVQALHNEGIGVIQDCVYNHTQSLAFSYSVLVPGYFHRANSNGSGCGNDVASERSMVSKYIVDSVKYWATEYHMDGFRFDLMGLEDVDTMNNVRKALNEIDPTIIVYGEGWTMGTNITKEILLTTQKNASATEGIAYFSDGIRDAVINASFGSEGKKPGYANGAPTNIEDMKGYLTARYTSNAKDPAVSPTQVVNYVTCHDGFTLWDKIRTSNADDSEEDQVKQAKLSYAMILTSQGIPFILSGDEFLRTKTSEEGTFVINSYMSGDKVNALVYNDMEKHGDMYDYLKGLIAFRGAHSAFRYTTFDEIDSTYTWLDGLDDQVIAYTIKGDKNDEVADNLMVIYNPNATETKVTLPEGQWQVCVNGEKAGTDVIETVSGEVTVTPRSCYALVQGETKPAQTQEPTSTTSTSSTSTNTSSSNEGGSKLPIVIVIIVVIVIAGVVIIKKRN